MTMLATAREEMIDSAQGVKIFVRSYHDLLNDVGKEQVMADVMNWIEARLPVAS